MSTSIYTLMDSVRNHPDYVWGTVFSWADVEGRLEVLQEDGQAQHLTPGILRQYSRSFEKAVEIACMEGGDWTEAIDDVIRDIKGVKK